MISEVTRSLQTQEDLYSIAAGNSSLIYPVNDRIVDKGTMDLHQAYTNGTHNRPYEVRNGHRFHQ